MMGELCFMVQRTVSLEQSLQSDLKVLMSLIFFLSTSWSLVLTSPVDPENFLSTSSVRSFSNIRRSSCYTPALAITHRVKQLALLRDFGPAGLCPRSRSGLFGWLSCSSRWELATYLPVWQDFES